MKTIKIFLTLLLFSQLHAGGTKAPSKSVAPNTELDRKSKVALAATASLAPSQKRVVLVTTGPELGARADGGWEYFSHDPSAPVSDLLKTASDFAHEHFPNTAVKLQVRPQGGHPQSHRDIDVRTERTVGQLPTSPSPFVKDLPVTHLVMTVDPEANLALQMKMLMEGAQPIKLLPPQTPTAAPMAIVATINDRIGGPQARAQEKVDADAAVTTPLQPKRFLAPKPVTEQSAANFSSLVTQPKVTVYRTQGMIKLGSKPLFDFPNIESLEKWAKGQYTGVYDKPAGKVTISDQEFNDRSLHSFKEISNLPAPHFGSIYSLYVGEPSSSPTASTSSPTASSAAIAASAALAHAPSPIETTRVALDLDLPIAIYNAKDLKLFVTITLRDLWQKNKKSNPTVSDITTYAQNQYKTFYQREAGQVKLLDKNRQMIPLTTLANVTDFSFPEGFNGYHIMVDAADTAQKK